MYMNLAPPITVYHDHGCYESLNTQQGFLLKQTTGSDISIGLINLLTTLKGNSNTWGLIFGAYRWLFVFKQLVFSSPFKCHLQSKNAISNSPQKVEGFPSWKDMLLRLLLSFLILVCSLTILHYFGVEIRMFHHGKSTFSVNQNTTSSFHAPGR